MQAVAQAPEALPEQAQMAQPVVRPTSVLHRTWKPLVAVKASLPLAVLLLRAVLVAL